MAHRIREAMKSDTGGMFGSGGGEVEVDETFIGRKAGEPIYHGHEHKMAVMTLIDRDSGAARSMVIPGRLRLDTLKPMLDANIAKEARIRTDEARHYMKLGNTFAEHKSVNHSAGEYVSREDRSVHTNRVEGYYSVFKRGMRGVYQHCAEHHLHRYMHEFDFRYSNRSALGIEDNERAEKAVKGTVGRRLTYHPPRAKAATA
ncbi:MAG: IS1595 family transposase, partial [Proteobacteria bacterium]|nr:IS1595 family transposase [Pseudomonadota bacterium]